MTASAQTASAQTQPDAFVLDTSAQLRLYLADGPLPPSLELAMQRGVQWRCLAVALKHDALLITADKQLAKAAASLGYLADAELVQRS